jgi:hypothetical protein
MLQKATLQYGVSEGVVGSYADTVQLEIQLVGAATPQSAMDLTKLSAVSSGTLSITAVIVFSKSEQTITLLVTEMSSARRKRIFSRCSLASSANLLQCKHDLAAS